MQIFVRAPTGKLLALDIQPSDTIERVKEAVYEETRMPPKQQRLGYGEKTLEDHRTLADYNIQKQSTLQLHLRWASRQFCIHGFSCPVCLARSAVKKESTEGNQTPMAEGAGSGGGEGDEDSEDSMEGEEESESEEAVGNVVAEKAAAAQAAAAQSLCGVIVGWRDVDGEAQACLSEWLAAPAQGFKLSLPPNAAFFALQDQDLKDAGIATLCQRRLILLHLNPNWPAGWPQA